MEETRTLLAAVEDHGGYPTRLVTHLLYGAGLRVTEPLELRIKDVDVAARRLVIRGAKGGKDRVVELPLALAGAIVGQMRLRSTKVFAVCLVVLHCHNCWPRTEVSEILWVFQT